MLKFSQISEEDKAMLLYYKPRRLSRKGLNDECCICNRRIIWNQIYYDGGSKKKAHEHCVLEYIK